MNQTIHETYRKLLKEFVSFKSISTDSQYAGEMKKTADWLVGIFKQEGFKAKLLKGQHMNDVVFASYTVSPKAETVLIYGHYDVQPAEKKDGWDSDPFVLTEKNGRFICRGAIDNKGQVLVHIATIFELIAEKSLKYNIKFMIEGNEESGSPSMDLFVKKYAKELSSDFVLISDGETAGNKPTLEASLRGGFNIRVTLETGRTNLHSGLYGGAAPSASKEATKLINSLFDFKTKKINVAGFYDGVKEPTKEQITNNLGIAGEKQILKTGGFKALMTEEGKYDFFTQVGLRPTLEISGIQTGYTGEGFANIVPAKTDIRINGRTVFPQKTADIMKKVVSHIKASVPSYVTVQVTAESHGNPVMVDTTSPLAKEILNTLEKTYKQKPVIKYVGGSIPIVGMFQQMLKTPVYLVSLANEDCNMHGVHENFDIKLLHKAVSFSRAFFSKES